MKPFDFEYWNSNKPRTFLEDGTEIKIVSIRFYGKNIDAIFYKLIGDDDTLCVGDEITTFMKEGKK